MTPIDFPSPNHEARPAGQAVDMLVLHYTGMPNGRAALGRLRDPEAKVSAHYLIDEDGSVYAMVPEDRRAWHAGVSYWRGRPDVNSRSIGIELVNPGHAFGYRDFSSAQMGALIALTHAILSRHPIPARNVVGHSDVAPARKIDPGERFDWRMLAEAGIGLWTKEWGDAGLVLSDRVEALRRWGYEVSENADEAAALSAFQRHFRPTRIDGFADEETAGLLARLLEMADNS